MFETIVQVCYYVYRLESHTCFLPQFKKIFCLALNNRKKTVIKKILPKFFNTMIMGITIHASFHSAIKNLGLQRCDTYDRRICSL
jgi:hypothetical protein